MKVVIAVDSFKGSLSSLKAGNAAADGIRRVFPDAEITVCPVADGGEGTVNALCTGLGGMHVNVPVAGPLGETVYARYAVIDNGKTAVMEMASAAGLPLVPPEKRNPLLTTTYGVGEMIAHAADRGCRDFIIGIGGSATNDGGVGMLQALGYAFLREDGTPISHGAAGLSELVLIDASDAMPALKECRFRIACDVTNPMCGENGCSAVFAPQKGATPAMIREMDRNLSRYAEITRTGEGKMDAQTAMGKAPAGVAAVAKQFGKPVIALAGCVDKGVQLCHNCGIDACFPIVRGAVPLEEAMRSDNAAANLADTAEQVFRLIKIL